MGWTVRE